MRFETRDLAEDTNVAISASDILRLIEGDTTLKKAANTTGGDTGVADKLKRLSIG